MFNQTTGLYNMAKVKVIVQILSPLPLTRHEDGRLVFDLWKRYLPGLLPDKFGNSEPIDQEFDSEKIESALDAWKWPFLATKTKWSMESSVWVRKGGQRTHATWLLSFDLGASSQPELIEFLKAASVALKADFACLHLLTPHEIERGRARGAILVLNKQATRFAFNIASKDPKRRIPDLFWATVFGGPYVEMFGRQQLLSAPVREVQSLSSGGLMLQLSELMTDLETHPTEIDEIRSRTVAHLGQDAFFQPELSSDHNFRVPLFTFP